MTLYEHSSLVRKYAEYEDAATSAARFAGETGAVAAIVRESYYDGARWATGYNAMSWDAMLAGSIDPSDIVAFRWPAYASYASLSSVYQARHSQLRDLYEAQLVHDTRALAAALDA